MARSTLLIALGALLTVVALPAAAADLGLPPPPPMMEEGGGLSELGAGWYLRGDLGYVHYEDPKDEPYARPAILLERERLEDTFSASFGAGYKFQSVFRVDLTADYRSDTGFDGSSSQSLVRRGNSRDWADFESISILANGYLDLGSWYGITPYIGGGVGVAENRFHEYYRQPCLGACGTPNEVLARRTQFIPGRTVHNFAWALMAGAAVEVGHGFAIDVGYRYASLGPSHTDQTRRGLGTKLEDLHAHEARVGVRYLID